MRPNAAGFPKILARALKNAGITGHNKKSNAFGLHPLALSIIYILLTLYLAEQLRKLVNHFTKNETLVRQLLLEFIATLELCAACFELLIVAENFGVGTYALLLWLLTLWWSTKWGDATACPYCPMEEAFTGGRTWQSALKIIGVQLVAAVFTFRYVQLLWAMELAETHKDKAYEECTADLQVDMVLGSIVECALTCSCRVVSKILAVKSFKFCAVVDAFFATTMVVLAFNLSGGYFNPALATSLKFGCAGNTIVEHLFTYWVGSCTGALLSCIIFESNAVQRFLKGESVEERKDE
ncbi:aquaporin-11 isoform X1 [Euwallacea fornicatus]|uniref:aquaporin-11 isoform X1 n=1 Tax=Euwallacea fornicatus TaxID=995702 RepID=UPI00338D6C67